jgi:hypothetical protein
MPAAGVVVGISKKRKRARIEKVVTMEMGRDLSAGRNTGQAERP